MKKKIRIIFVGIFISLFFPLSGNQNDYNSIASKIKQSIESSLDAQRSQALSVVRLDNFSGLKDLAILRLYQNIAQELEGSDKINFKDLFMGINNQKAEFKMSNNIELQMYLRVTREIGSLGVGITIYSTKINSLIYIKYFTVPIKNEEIALLEFNAYNLSKKKFIPLLEKDFFYQEIYDVESYSRADGQVKLAILLDKKIDLFVLKGRVLERDFTINYNEFSVDSGVKEREGRINYFEVNGKSYIAIGFNDSIESQLFVFSDGKWSFLKKLNYLPHGQMSIGSKKLILGYKYFLGRDYFSKEIILGDKETFKSLYKKNIRDFYDINLVKEEGNSSIYISQLNNKIGVYSNSFNKELQVDGVIVGSQLTYSQDNLFYTSTQIDGDKVFVYDIKKNETNNLFSTQDSIVKFKKGDFMGIKGLWIITQDSERNKKMIFYGKKL